MKLCKMLLAVLGATALLGALVGTASAGRFSVSEQRVTSTYSRVSFSGGFGTTVCDVTLEGSLHSRTINKVRVLIGYITGGNTGNCIAGTSTILRERLPFHIQYASFVGTLPDITSIVTNVIGAAFRIREPGGFECLVTSSSTNPTTGTYNLEAGGRISTIRIGGSVPCGIFTGTLNGTSNSITPSVSIRLI